MNKLKDLFEKFICLPAEMKMLFIALVFLILFISKFGLISCKSKPTEIQKANIQIKLDSLKLSKIQHEKDSINRAFVRNADSAEAVLYAKYGIVEIK